MVGSRGGVLQKQLLTNVSGGVAVVTVVVAVVVVVVMVAVVVVVVAVPLSFPAHGGMNPLVFLGPISGLVPGIPLSFWVQRWAPYGQSACTGMAKWHPEHSILLVLAWQTWTPYRG